MRIGCEWEATGAELNEGENTGEAEIQVKQNTRITEKRNEKQHTRHRA